MVSKIRANKKTKKGGNDLTASKTLTKRPRERAQEVPKQESSNSKEQHSVSQIREHTKPSSSSKRVVSRTRKPKRFPLSNDRSRSSSVTSVSQRSDCVPGSPRNKSCSSLSSWTSVSTTSHQGRSRPSYQTVNISNPSTSRQTSRPKFKRRNSPHPRIIKAKRAKTHKRSSCSRSASTASSASKVSNEPRRTKQGSAKSTTRGANSQK